MTDRGDDASYVDKRLKQDPDTFVGEALAGLPPEVQVRIRTIIDSTANQGAQVVAAVIKPEYRSDALPDVLKILEERCAPLPADLENVVLPLDGSAGPQQSTDHQRVRDAKQELREKQDELWGPPEQEAPRPTRQVGKAPGENIPVLVLSQLLHHHQYDGGHEVHAASVLNPAPAKQKDILSAAGLEVHQTPRVSEAFKELFGSHKKYKISCRNGSIADKLRKLSGEEPEAEGSAQIDGISGTPSSSAAPQGSSPARLRSS